jgi:hypothetical protein
MGIDLCPARMFRHIWFDFTNFFQKNRIQTKKHYEKNPSSCGIVDRQRLCGMVGRSPGQSV